MITRHTLSDTLPPRDFTPAEKALIARVGRHLPAQQILAVLNERLRGDLGPDASLHTMDQLTGLLGKAAPAPMANDNDWTRLRKLLAQARSDGVLGLIDETVINDFAVVFRLSAKQVLTLKDILLQPEA